MTISGNRLEILMMSPKYHFFILSGFIIHERYHTDDSEDEITLFIDIYASTLTCKSFLKGREIDIHFWLDTIIFDQ